MQSSRSQINPPPTNHSRCKSTAQISIRSAAAPARRRWTYLAGPIPLWPSGFTLAYVRVRVQLQPNRTAIAIAAPHPHAFSRQSLHSRRRRVVTFNASSWLMDVNGVPFTSSMVSPGRRPARSASEPSSMREMYTPTPDRTQRHGLAPARYCIFRSVRAAHKRTPPERIYQPIFEHARV